MSRSKQIVDVAAIAANEGMGTVLTLGAGKDFAGLEQAARTFLGHHPSMADVLIDADRYSGNDRVTDTALNRAWITAQHDQGSRHALTDSPFIDAGDHRALRSVLSQAEHFGDHVVVALPLALRWLTQDANVLVEAINRCGMPVALMLEHRDDPYAVKSAVRGLVAVIDGASPPVGVLRCDLSAVGALAYGASFGAIGATISLRHIYPATAAKQDDRRPFPSQTAAYHPASMTYRSLQKISLAAAADADDIQRWECRCRWCHGQPITRIDDEAGAYQHSFAATSMLAADVLNHPDPQTARATWTQRCLHAQTVNMQIEDETGIAWKAPGFLGSWVAVAAR